jgi:hypothetical protein
MPRKVFEAFTRLDAADVNSFLMDQSVMVFDDDTARTAAIPSPIEGMVTYLKDSDTLWIYDGVVWVLNPNGPAIQKWSNQGTVIDTISRQQLNGFAINSGTVYFSFFTPIVNLTVSQITMANLQNASAGLTLARMGLYTVDSSDNADLVARTASDTTLFDTAITSYTRSFDTTGGYPATYDLVAGQRYAIAVICVGTTMPNIVGYFVANIQAVTTLLPRISGVVTSQADLPTSRTSFAGGTTNPFGRLS